MKKNIVTLARFAVLAATTAGALFSSVQAADYYLQSNQGAGWNWGTVSHNTGWWTARTGGTTLSAIDPEGTYYTNGRDVRTPEGSGVRAFGGALLVLETGSSLMLKTNSSGSALVNNLRVENDSRVTASNGAHYHYLTVNNFNVAGDVTFFTSTAGRSMDLTFGNIVGSGNITLDGVAATDNFRLDVINATAYAGTVTLNTGTLRLDSSLVTAGALVLSQSARLELSHSITVSSLTIGGTVLDGGVYDYNYLSTTFADIFLAGDFSGSSITVVPEAAHVASALALLCVASVVYLRRRRR